MMGEKLVQPDLRTEHDGGEHATSRTAQTSSGRVRFTTAMLTLLNLFFTWLVCRYVPSTPGAFRVPAVAAHARMHSYFSACFAAFAGLVCLGSYVSPDKAVGRGNDVGLGIAVSACVCYLLPVLRWAPVLLSAAGKAPLHPHRNVTWCFTTSMLSYSLWTGSSNNPPWELYVSWVGNALCMLAGVPSACSNGFWLWFWYTGSCAALVATGVMQWRFVGRALEDVSDLPRTYNALQRLRFLFLLAWLSFPASFALQFTGLVSGNVGEFLLSFADLFSKGVLQAAYAQGVAVSAEDRRHLRLQLISTSLVKELQEKERQKDLFVASLVHELRTPLNGIIGITESLLSTEKNSFSEKCFQALTTVCETGHRFSQLINDILDNASLQENALKLVFQRVNVHILLSESLHLITPLVNPKEVKVVLSMPPELPIIEGDFNRLVQVMFNLLCNASKFTLKGKITVTAKEENKMIRIDVRDTGEGIPENMLDAVFLPFKQVDMSKTRTHGGTGLGLSLARQLVKAHDGTISVSSKVGEGSCFTVLLPIGTLRSKGITAISRSESQNEIDPNPTSSMADGKSQDTSKKPTPVQNAVALKRKRSSGIFESWLTPKDSDLARFIQSWRDERAGKRMAEVVLLSDGPSYQTKDIEEYLSGAKFSVVNIHSAVEAVKYLETRYSADGLHSIPAIIVIMDRGDGVFGSNTLTQIRDLLPLLTLPIMVLGCKDTDVACSMLDNGCNDVIKSAEPGLDLVSRVKLQTRLRMEHLIEVARVREEQSAYSLLPLSVINRINNGESQILDRLEEVTIMHCSVVDVPGMSELMSPSSAMHLLTKVLNHMDRLSESHLYHRVHASGQQYVVMSGHSHTSRDGHAKHILALARQIMYTLDDMDPVSGWRLRVRIGVHTGPVVAAVAGGISCRYFVLGRTMLVAQQISESVSPMSIAISAATRDALHKIEPDAVRDFYELGRVTIRGNSLQVWGQQIRNWEEARLITPGSEYLLSSRTIEILQASVYVLSERVEDLLAISAQSQSSHLLAGAGGLGKADVSHLQDLLEKTASVVAALQHHTSTSSLNGFEVEAAKPILLGESLEQFREQAVVGGGSGPVSSHLLAEADKVLEPLAACKRKVQDKQKQMDLDARMLADMETTGEPSQPRNEFQGGPDDLSFCVDKPAAMEDHAADRSTPNIEAERLSDSNCTTSPSNRDRLDALPSSSSSNTRPTAPSDAALLAFLKDIGMERYYETLHIHEVDVPMLLKKQQPSDLAEVGLQHPSGQQQLFQAMHQDATLSYPEGEAVVPSADSLHAQTRQAGDDS